VFGQYNYFIVELQNLVLHTFVWRKDCRMVCDTFSVLHQGVATWNFKTEKFSYHLIHKLLVEGNISTCFWLICIILKIFVGSHEGLNFELIWRVVIEQCGMSFSILFFTFLKSAITCVMMTVFPRRNRQIFADCSFGYRSRIIHLSYPIPYTFI